MKDFAGKIAVITGGGTGMGRELARQLVAEGCNVAMCDVSEAAMAETRRLCEVEKLPQGLRVTTHVADVAIEDHLKRFRDELAEQQKTDKIHLLFNNAGIGGGGSLFTNTREQWERTFNICWGGVYLGVRTFLPMLVAADEAHIVNTASVNGFWASIGMGQAHTAYSSAKFAVKGFTEALINDLRLHAPHVKCSVVMPGHIGTSIVSNSRKVQSTDGSERLNADEVALTAQAHGRGRRAGCRQDVGRGHPGGVRRARPQLPGGCSDDGCAGREDHPRRGQGGALAHPRGRGRQTPRRARARDARAGL
ncbi:NAD(P)-dependent dehydrogenase (short-subunit alcohol dehydrogenase family) [Bradyrhizobium diazoefficiens]